MVEIKKNSEHAWEIPKTGKMLVPGIVYASEALIKNIKQDKTLEQVKNVAQLPGILKASFCMPDAHQGYGFPIGGVAAFDLELGVVSPGGVGYDINCGVRLLATNLSKEKFMLKRKEVTHDIVRNVPVGVGRGTKTKLTDKDLDDILNRGVKWAVEKGFGLKEDLEKIEDNGAINGADAYKVSQRAKARGRDQLGTLGAGNHFIDVQVVEEIYDKKIAKIFGIEKEGQITVMIHCGSRGLGHQVASDYIKLMEDKYGWSNLPDRELICAPINSPLGKDYRDAMAAAANFAFTNRQMIMYDIKEVFKKHFPESEVKLVYDIAHNMAKFEKHTIGDEEKEVCVHRKGATRSFGPGREEIPKIYRDVGCPIFIPGSMGTSSYVLVGTKKAEEVSFGSTAHGSGRVMSRTAAKKQFTAEDVKKILEKKDVYIEAQSKSGMVEESPEVYKNVDEVVRVSNELGIGNLVAKLRPIAVIIG